MASSIPYDPRLTLGGIVDNSILENLEKIGALQAPIDSALAELNSAISLRRKLDMTDAEIQLLVVSVDALKPRLEDVNTEIVAAATSYASQAVAQLPQISAARKSIAQVSDTLESPVDWNKSQFKQVPISTDSIVMDVQYFSLATETQTSDQSMQQLKAFVSASTSFLGDKASTDITNASGSQLSKQNEIHDIEGTLVITAGLTHKNALVFAPYILDVDKAIRVYNGLFPGDMLNPMDGKSIKDTAKGENKPSENKFHILSGFSGGSSFVGMVHVLKDSSTETSQKMRSVAQSLQGQMEVGSWFSDFKGGFGVDNTFANSAKQLLSSQNIQNHCSLVCMGVVPTIESNDVQIAVKQFTDFSPDKMMGQLAALQNSTASEQSSVGSAASNARTGGKMIALESAKISSAVSAVGALDDGKNKMLDINSLMTAFTDYVTKSADAVGCPINYFLKPINKHELAEAWIGKYLPGQYVTESADDADPKPPTGGDA